VVFNNSQFITKSNSLKAYYNIPEAMDIGAVKQPHIESTYDETKETSLVVILTTLQVESKAVQAYLDDLTEETHDGTVYTCGIFRTSNIDWKVVTAEIGAGGSSAGIEAGRAIQYFKPKAILFIGIAGGVSQIKIGDVVAATKLYNYDQSLQQPEARESSHHLEQRARAEARKEDWLQRIMKDPLKINPLVRVAPIASTAKTTTEQDIDIAKHIQAYYADVLAVETGGFGFLDAAHKSHTPAIVIRGISHLISRRGKVVTEKTKIIAAQHASAFAFEMLSKLHGNIITIRIQMRPKNDFPSSIIRFVMTEIDDSYYRIRVYNNSCEYANCCLSRKGFELSAKEHFDILKSDIAHDDLVAQLHRRVYQLQIYQPIAQMLNRLSGNFKAGSAILEIYDHVKLGIAWESIKVNGIPLGVTYQIVRQDTISGINITYSKEDCQGSILAHIKNQNPLWQSKYRHKLYSDFQEFFSYLHGTSEQHGLIFIDVANDKELIEKDPSTWIEYSEFLKGQASIVFVNGQLDFCTSLKLDHQKFIRLFNMHGVKGVISTMKIMNNDFTGQVIEKLFLLLEPQVESSPLTIPAILRNMREEAHDKLKDNPMNPAICSTYLAAFNYIYSGNPFTVLQLIPTVIKS
jgi:nucleoside phosphorylase